MPVVRVLLMVLALLAVAMIAGAVSGVAWYAVERLTGVVLPFAVYLLPALVAFAALFGWLLARSPAYPGASMLAVACALFIPLRLLIAIVTEDTTLATALIRGIAFAGILYAAARLTQARRAAAAARSLGEAG